MIRQISVALFFTALLAGGAFATPVLKPVVQVIGPVVTVGDMFDDAGSMAATALFRAPAPGTSGVVSLDAIRNAAGRVGLANYDAGGLSATTVSRAASLVDDAMLSSLVARNLSDRRLVPEGVTIRTTLDSPVSLKAEAVDEPARLTDIAYQAGGKMFSARFRIAGYERPLEITGRIDLMVSVPHLAGTLPAGSILTPSDIEMKQVPLEFTDRTGIADIGQIVGKALKRNTRAGLLLKTSDIEEPMIVRRNGPVTVVFRTGPLTLTVQAQALGDASVGGTVQVMNSVTHKLLNGIAMADGSVEVTTGPLQTAGL
jgi:flagellar basal body P-ring formation protein FlgA